MVKIVTELKNVGGSVSASRQVIQLNGATVTTWNQVAVANNFETAWEKLRQDTLNECGYGSPRVTPEQVVKINQSLQQGKAVKIDDSKLIFE